MSVDTLFKTCTGVPPWGPSLGNRIGAWKGAPRRDARTGPSEELIYWRCVLCTVGTKVAWLTRTSSAVSQHQEVPDAPKNPFHAVDRGVDRTPLLAEHVLAQASPSSSFSCRTVRCRLANCVSRWRWTTADLKRSLAIPRASSCSPARWGSSRTRYRVTFERRRQLDTRPLL